MGSRFPLTVGSRRTCSAARRESSLAAARSPQVQRTLQVTFFHRMSRRSTESERRVPIKELVENVAVLPDHLEVAVSGAPRLHTR